MQQGDAKQKSKFKTLRTVGAWALVPGLGVPITKLVESYYDVSFFSSAVSGLWSWILSVGSWLGQSAPVPAWTLVAITICALLMAGALIWVVVDANGRLAVADADLDAANARIKMLESPPKSTLTDNAHEVVMWVAGLTINNMVAYPPILADRVGLDPLQMGTALDELQEQGLIEFDDSVDLTPRGRVYVQHPDNLKRRREA